MQILAYRSAVGRTGGHRYFEEYLSALAQNHEVRYITLTDEAVFSAACRRTDPFRSWALLQEARNWKADILLCDSRLYGNLWALPFLLPLTSLRLFTTYQDQGGHIRVDKINPFVKFIRRFCLRNFLVRAHFILTNSSISAGELTHDFRIAPSKFEMVNPGFEPSQSATSIERPTSADNDKLQIFLPGRYELRKGMDILVDALKLLPPETYEAHISGGPLNEISQPLYQSLYERAESLPISLYKHYLSNDELLERYVLADVVVIPSRIEGFGIVALEGLWHGRNVVASDVLPEELRRANSHIQSFPNGDISALADCLRDLIKRKQNGESLVSTKPLISPEDWSWQRFHRQVNDMIKKYGM